MNRKPLIAFFLSIIFYCGEILPLYAQDGMPQTGLAVIKLEVQSKSGTNVFDVEMATDDLQRSTGMMWRSYLAPDKGMFFIFDEAARKNFTMRNCLIPLDLIYIRSNGRVVNIERNAQPGDMREFKSRGPVLAVLEIAGGRAQELGIRPGDRVVHSIFKAE